ncbi:MAG: hypothetical protein MUC65_02530 [Pontiellaceae bacterium]|jgi:hypothetical protein|nr:hypothetical protein [Pontiellaceae bacterium]
MLKKIFFLTLITFSAGMLPAQEVQTGSEITMLVMPCEGIPLQIGQDISRRYPVLLVSYQKERGQLALHAWNGDTWLEVSVKDYANGTFFSRQPAHAIIVESRQQRASDALIPGFWCKKTSRLTSTDTRTLIHLLGLHFDFPFRHWEQFAKRYHYEIEQINPTLQNVHWWNLQGDVFLEKLAKRDFSVDLDNWYDLEPDSDPMIGTVVPKTKTAVSEPVFTETAEPVSTTVDITAKAPDTTPLMEELQMIVEKPIAETAPETDLVLIDSDPFSTEEIPPAEVVAPDEPKKSWWKR